MFRICYNFRIVGGQRLSRGRDVGGAVPYKRDRIVFLFCPTMVVIVDLFLRRANSVRPYRFVAVILSDIYIFNFQVAFGVRHWVLCPWLRIHKISNAHPRFDTSTLQPVPESLIVFTKSQGLYVPASIKTLSTYPENHHFCCIKNATIAEMLPN